MRLLATHQQVVLPLAVLARGDGHALHIMHIRRVPWLLIGSFRSLFFFLLLCEARLRVLGRQLRLLLPEDELLLNEALVDLVDVRAAAIALFFEGRFDILGLVAE